MPRLARLDACLPLAGLPASGRLVCLWQAPGVLHHVMGRGIERRKIFLNTKNRNDCISRLEQLAEERSMAVYAWALLENHFHLLCKTNKRPLSASMRRLS